MSSFQSLITVFPTVEAQALQWWLVTDGAVEAKGTDADPMFAAGLKLLSAENEPVTHIALMPSALTTVRWHAPLDDITPQQALAAARIAAQKSSLGLENLHIAAVVDASGQAATAGVGKNIMASGLVQLKALGIDPDKIIPVGWLIAPEDDGVVEADFGFETVLRGEQMIIPDEPSLRAHLIGESRVTVLPESVVDRALVDAADNESLNLRSGAFAKKSYKLMTTKQKRTLGWLALAAIVVSLLIPVIQLVKYHWAARDADVAALAAAQPVIGSVDNVEEADRRLNERLISENRGNIAFSVPASALFSALQQTQGVSIERISYRKDGTVSAGLTAARNEDINPALLAIQNAGFVITATPRTDATGSSKADITVRAP
ncbi:MAG: type II secretion system protein GspL [Parasphingorhabdus sp.]|uniref:type II secretion system protein GspL n=1 Tax=Parasphingorhabdus sp. TaxID=2709688 RepID=UPI00300175EC